MNEQATQILPLTCYTHSRCSKHVVYLPGGFLLVILCRVMHIQALWFRGGHAENYILGNISESKAVQKETANSSIGDNKLAVNHPHQELRMRPLCLSIKTGQVADLLCKIAYLTHVVNSLCPQHDWACSRVQ
jgi:hypothetical protein